MIIKLRIPNSNALDAPIDKYAGTNQIEGMQLNTVSISDVHEHVRNSRLRWFEVIHIDGKFNDLINLGKAIAYV